MALTTLQSNPNQTLAAGGLEGATDDVISMIFWNRFASLLFYLYGTAGYIGARAYNSASISVPNAANTTLTFNTDRFDSDPNGDIHSTSTNTSRLVCRTAGTYLVGASVVWAANATGRRILTLQGNGTNIQQDTRPAMATGDTAQIISTVWALAASQYFEVVAFQDSGGALNAQSLGDGTSLEFWMIKL